MKSIVLAAAISVAATAAFAGGVSQPKMEPMIVEEQAAGSAASSGGVLVPLVVLLVLWAATQ